ncbi:MAG: prolipoprotein diacylglyceryl transferase [Clostridiales bacterium]|jgi:phosphatidylglycerol:prolipoprotein diacylglycerol transferase|nr:prolipoprotein diacylglyceryl transferase [Clostridiales bacterium]
MEKQRPMPVNLYGLAIALGVAAAIFYMSRQEAAQSLPQDTAIDVALYAVPLALVVSRLYFVAFTWEDYKDDLFKILRIWEGGVAIYGGIIGGAIGVYALSRRRKLPFLALADLVAPALLLGQAIGRWGNFFNQEAYGYMVSQPAFQFFPVAVYADGSWHMATFFYESIWNLAGFVFLHLNRKRFTGKGRGMLFAWYLIWYGLGRMVIEGLRTDSLMWGSLRISQVVSVVLVLAAGAWVLWRLRPGKSFFVLPSIAALAGVLAANNTSAWAIHVMFISLFAFSGTLLQPFCTNKA